MTEIPAKLRTVLEAATRAPSGENSQPWRFEASSNDDVSFSVAVRIREKDDQSLYGWGNRAVYVAMGAALENMRIAASGVDLFADISLLPDPKDERYVAFVTLTPSSETVKNELVDTIPLRVSNRKPYKEDPLSQLEVDTLTTANNESGYGKVMLTSDREDIKSLAEFGSTNEQVMLANPALHRFFFDHINWTRKEDEARKTGFFIDTLELQPPARAGFKLLSSWTRARFLNKVLKMNEVVGKENAKIYAQSSAIGVILSPQESAIDAIRAGMLVERVWLEATRLGLSLQPLAGTLYFALRLHAGETEGFNQAERLFIEERYQHLRDIFKFDSEIPYFMFRVGRSDAPSARAIRFAVEEVATFQTVR